MSQEGKVTLKCKLCGGTEGLTHIGVFSKDEEPDAELNPDRILWVCEGHYTRLLKADEYRIREIPETYGELDHSSREEIDEDGEEYVTIMEPNNENKWLKFPHILETDLEDER